MKRISVLILGFIVVGCGSNQDRFKEQLDATNQNQSDLAEGMEATLASWQSYYKALSGEYEGTYKGLSGRPFQMRLKLTFLPAYIPPKRVRTLDEIENDLNNLFLTAEEIVWDDEVPITMGCVYENVRAHNLVGKIYLASGDCKVSFSLSISDDTKIQDEGSGLASQVFAGVIKEVQGLRGTAQSIHASAPFQVELTRVKP